MKLLKLILFIFAIYFIRRFFQVYKAMKRLHAEQMNSQARPENRPKAGPQGHVVNAEYKVIKDA